MLGWANWNAASLTPSFSGGATALTLAQVGAFTLSTITDNRFRDAHGSGPTTDTIGVRGTSGGGLASGEGFQISFVPGAVGSYKLTIHTTDFGGGTNWAAAAGATSLGTGALPNTSGLDEGPVAFNLTVANTTEAAATWTIQLTAGGATALTVNSASLVATTPPQPPAPVVGLGRLLCIGDSITEGKATRPAGEGDWSWRYWCWQNFIDFGTAHEFVGTRTANNSGSSVYPYYASQTFANRHEAIWGTSFQERATSTPTFLGSLKTSGKTPDTAVIFGGGNDIPLDLSVAATVVRDRTKTIVDHLQGDLGTAGNSNIRILLVAILPRFAAPPANTPDVRNTRYTEINTLLAALATAETTATSKVEYLNVHLLFTTPADGHLYDGVHPDGSGEQLLGNAIFAALVPNMNPVSIRLQSMDDATHAVNFLVRTHGPRQVRIEASPDLSAGSWSTLVAQALNPGEWTPVTCTHPSALSSRWFFRAVAP